MRAPREVEQNLGVKYADLNELVPTADIVSLHLPLLPQTAGIINATRIRAMKSDAVLINCARGGLVDEAALAAALKEGRLFRGRDRCLCQRAAGRRPAARAG